MIGLLLAIHFIADFLLQSREMGKKKSTDPSWLIKHLGIQFLAFLLFLAPILELNAIWFAFLNAVIHGIIDWNIWRLYKIHAYRSIADNPNHPLLTGNPAEPWKYWEDHWFYATIGFDQLLHGLTLVALARLFL